MQARPLRSVVPQESLLRSWREALGVLAKPAPGYSMLAWFFRDTQGLRQAEPLLRGWWDALVILLARPHPGGPSMLAWFFRVQEFQFWRFRRGVFTSVLLHLSVIAFLIRVPSTVFLRADDDWRRQRLARVVYPLRGTDSAQYLATLLLAGPGGSPGRGTGPVSSSQLGSTTFHPRVTIVSNPARADNDRQTIAQLSLPPDLRTSTEVRLPDILIGGSVPAPNFPLQIVLVPPVLVRGGGFPDPPVAPELGPAPAAAPWGNPMLNLPVVLPALLRGSPVHWRGDDPGVPGMDGTDGGRSEASGLLVLGSDPASLEGRFILPLGNRQGAFSVSRSGADRGAPGGVREKGGGGVGGQGTGGDPSTGVGSGGIGGGVNRNANPTFGGLATVRGNGAGGPELDDSDLFSLVFRLTSQPTVRSNPVIVSAGPAGGGGLGIYGVLSCGNIYTVYLSMPDGYWILEYCAPDNPLPRRKSEAPSVRIRLDAGLEPPEAETRFDFHRFPLAEGGAGAPIVLRGVIEEDGSINHLTVLRGVGGVADQAALAAFSRWHFKPALRAGKPVAVDFLVGIPPGAAGR